MDYFVGWLERIQWQDASGVALRILLILVMAWGALTVARLGFNRLERRMARYAELQGEGATEAVKRADTLTRLLRQGMFMLVLVLAALMILQEAGVSIAPVLASAGIAGLAVGFGAQNLVRDVISGFFLILENQVRVGDVAIVNGTGGSVEAINFRTLVLRDLSGVVHVFPNGAIQTLSNMTKEWSAYVFEIRAAYKEDTDRVVALIEEVAADLRDDAEFGAYVLAEVEIFGVDRFDDSAVIIKGRLRTRPGKQWALGREFLRRCKQRFDSEGVEIPFPHRTIYFGESSQPFLTLIQQKDATERADRAGQGARRKTAPKGRR